DTRFEIDAKKMGTRNQQRSAGTHAIHAPDKNFTERHRIKKSGFSSGFLFYVRYAFFTNSVRSTIAVLFTLQSISAGSSVRRMFFTMVPRLITSDEPRTLRSLMTVTESPSFRIFPLLSLTSMILI